MFNEIGWDKVGRGMVWLGVMGRGGGGGMGYDGVWYMGDRMGDGIECVRIR